MMRRMLVALGMVVAVAICVAIGLIGRSLWNGSAGQRQDAAQTGAPSSAPTAVAANPPAAPAAAPTRPTAPATPTPSSKDVVMEVTEGDLQSQLSKMLVGQPLGSTPLGEATVQSVTVALQDRQVKVGGNAKAGFLTAPFAAAGTVAPNGEGRPIVKVNEASVGGVALPDPARAAIADSLQTQVDGLFAERAMKVRAIEIADGKMRVVGTSGS